MSYSQERITQNEANRAYCTLLDVDAFKKIDRSSPQLPTLLSLVRHNVETSIGERFNAEFFQETYQLKDNLIFHPYYDEQFIEVLKRGQKYRHDNGSNDQERESAEIEGFQKVQQILSRPNAPKDEKVIVISPKGSSNSIYQHNFYDLYQKGPDNKIIMTRLTCKFSYEEFLQGADLVDPLNELSENADDVEFLSNPLITYKSLDEIKSIFSPQENVLSKKEYERLIQACAPLIIAYINGLCEDPNEFKSDLEYHRILKFAHIYTGIGEQTYDSYARQEIIREINRPQSLQMFAHFIDQQTLPQVKVGCGISGQNSNKIKSLFRPFSLVDFSNIIKNSEDEDEEVEDFQCPGQKEGKRCTYIIKAYSGITKCPECGLEATCA